MMNARGIADARQLAELTQVLIKHCEKNEIVDDELREAVARQIIALFNAGITDLQRLLARLEDAKVMMPPYSSGVCKFARSDRVLH